MNKNLTVRKVFFVAAIFVFLSANCSANQFSDEENDLGLTVDFAYHPLAAQVASGVSHYAPVTEFYEGLEFRGILSYERIFKIPFGENFLVSGNTLRLGTQLELSPVSIIPKLQVSVTPVAFLRFTLGARAGSGWEFLGIKGLAEYDDASGEYKELPAFQNWFYEFNFESLFQFDLAALIPGDWNHVVMMATYEIIYHGVTGLASGKPFMLQGLGEKVNGWNYYSSVLLGYQMPMVLQTVGVQAEFMGYYDSASFDSKYRDFKGDFMSVSINPACILKFSEQDSLMILAYFSTRRGYDSEKKTVDGRKQSELDMNYSAPEWYFKRIAFRYIHKF